MEEPGEVLASTIKEASTTQKPFVLNPAAHFIRKLFSFVEPTVQHCNSCCDTYYKNRSFVYAIFRHCFVDYNECAFSRVL